MRSSTCRSPRLSVIKFDQEFKTLLAYCSNIARFYSERGRETWKDLSRRGWLVNQQLEAARESLGRVESEISRIL